MAPILSTTITDKRVELVIGDHPDREQAAFWLHFAVTLDVDRGQQLSGVQLAALHRLRTELSAQIQAITHNRDLRP